MKETAFAEALGAVRCTPVPDWVEHNAYLLHVPEGEDSFVAAGVVRLLQDVQINLSNSEQAWHSCTAQRVLTRAGAERIAHFVADFDPSFERLEVHFIRILRGEERIEHARPDGFQFFRRETNLERLALNGRLTASLLIPDVRVDDIVEIGLTLYGSNPVLGGKFASWAVFDPFNPWLETRRRLLRPQTRDISVKLLNDPPKGETSSNETAHDSRWHLVGQTRQEAEALTPPWLILSPAIQYSEFKNWQEVASLFAPLYDSPCIPDTLAQDIDQLAKTNGDPAQRAAEWLRFVQQKLRYFALSLGEGGLAPREVETIWSNRFGDCKDAARLYVAGARRMGLDACAALVSTTHGPTLKQILPSPLLFDHCIVRLRLNGISYWLDPTSLLQSGDLQTIFQPHFGWALPLTSETTQLEELSSQPPLHHLHYEDEFRLGPKSNSIAKLRRDIDYSFWAADSMRNRFAGEGSAEYSKEMLKDLQMTWPDVSETEPLVINDDPVKNCLTVTLNYDIANAWRQLENGKRLSFTLTDNVIGGHLMAINGSHRRTDIHLGRPRKLTSHVYMHMPRRWHGLGWSQTYEVPGIDYKNRLTIDGRTINYSKELTIKEWGIPAEHATAYNQLASELLKNQTGILAREWFGKIGPTSIRWQLYFRIIWGFFILILILRLFYAAMTP